MRPDILKGTEFTEYEAMIKIRVLYYSLKFESIVSLFLISKLKLNADAVSLGNTSRGLSMNQKLGLLLDSNLIVKEKKKYLEHFTAIRNQFMHNIYVNSLESCVSFINGSESFLKKNYCKKKKEFEESKGKEYEYILPLDKVDRELSGYVLSDNEKLLFTCWLYLVNDTIGCISEITSNLTDEELRRSLNLNRNPISIIL